MRLGRLATAGAIAMVATVAASGYVHRDTGPQVLASQEVPPPRPAPKHAAPVASVSAEPAASPYVIKRVLPIDGPMKIGDHHWDDAGVPPGELIITVDLAAQVLSVFRGGYEIGAAAILYGADAKPTPLGIYPITQKDADHVSNIYHAPMPYMLRLTNDGVAIHASDVQDGYMTHGCIGVPLSFARKLFGVAKLGDRVIVTRGEVLQAGKPIPAA
jgi:hypothetical protein